jgi:hypothetical protein
MSTLIAIDPGNKKQSGECATAIYKNSRLFWVGFAYPLHNITTAPDTRVVVERPQLYPRDVKRWTKERICAVANDLINLAMSGGLVAGRFRGEGVHMPTPREWKGQISKPQQHALLWQLLDSEERALFPSDTYKRIQIGIEANAPYFRQPLKKYGFATGNLLDAAALGATELGRFDKIDVTKLFPGAP